MLKSQSQKLREVFPKPIASLAVLTEAKIELFITPPPTHTIYGLIQVGAKEGRRERRKQRVVVLS